VNKHPFTIIGVAPPEFHGTLLFLFPDFFVPIVNQEQVNGSDYLNARGNRAVLQVMGHLKAGVTPEQAVAELNSIGAWIEKNYPKDVGSMNYMLGRPTFNGDFLGRPVRAFVAGLMLMAGLILLAACANLGSLFAARAADRGREVALRLALGASRNRILRQLLTEAVIISLIGGAAGLCGSIVLLRGLSGWQPLSRFPIHVPVHTDGRVFGVALALALVSGILFGLVPARQVRRTDPYQVIKAGPTGVAGRRIAVRELLLVVQVAICALLVTSSMVAARGLARSLHGPVGFEPRHAMLANTVLEMAGYRGDSVPAMQRRMIDAMQTIPGVRSAALTSAPPLDQAWTTTIVFTDETTDLRPPNAAAIPFLFKISPQYFHAAGTALLSGRTVTGHDDLNAPRVAVINQEFARKMFGSISNAMGRYYRLRDGARIQVVGVVEDGKYMSLTEDPQAAMFLPILQSPASDAWLVVRSDRDPQELASAIRSKLRELDPALPAFIVTWNQDLEGALFPSRVATVALGVMGLMGAILALTGIFGMAAYPVSKRLRELGIRIALGARRKEVLDAGLGRALKLLGLGSAAGLILGILFTRVLAAIVYQATPRDPLVLAGVVLAMLFLGLLATWIPAQRALSLDPVTLLREE
jgi:predicted permease